jgi:uncharacterized protein YdeI (BOF family)
MTDSLIGYQKTNAEDATVAQAMENLDAEYAELCGSLVTV